MDLESTSSRDSGAHLDSGANTTVGTSVQSGNTLAGRSPTIVDAIALQPELEATLKLRNAFRDADKFYRLVRKPNGRTILPTDYTDVLDFRCPDNNTESNRQRIFKVAQVRCKIHETADVSLDVIGSAQSPCFTPGAKAQGACELQWHFLVEPGFNRTWQGKPEPGPPFVQRPKAQYKRYPGSYCLDPVLTQDDLKRVTGIDHHRPFKGPSRGAVMWGCRGLPGFYVITHALSEYDQLEWSLRAMIQHAESEHNNITNLAKLRALGEEGGSGGPCGGSNMTTSCRRSSAGVCVTASNEAKQESSCSQPGQMTDSASITSAPALQDQTTQADQSQPKATIQHPMDLFVQACAAFGKLKQAERAWVEAIAQKENVQASEVIKVLGIEILDEGSQSQDLHDDASLDTSPYSTGDGDEVSSHAEVSVSKAPGETNLQRLQRKSHHLRSIHINDPELQEARSQFQKANTALRELRWSSLGFHYDWTARSYHEASKSLFPASFRAAAISLVAPLVEKGLVNPVQPEAGIVNYYPLGSQMGAHIDDAEPAIEQPIVSVSLGAAAIFLIGTHDRTETPTAIYLRSGDVVIMDGPSRLCFHAVPRIIESSLNESGLRAAAVALLQAYKEDPGTRQVSSAAASTFETDYDLPELMQPELKGCFDDLDPSLRVGSLEDTALVQAIGPALERAGITIEEALEFLIVTLRETRINMNIRQVNDKKYGPPSTKRLKIPAEAANCGAYAAQDQETFQKLCQVAVTVTTCAMRKAGQTKRETYEDP